MENPLTWIGQEATAKPGEESLVSTRTGMIRTLGIGTHLLRTRLIGETKITLLNAGICCVHIIRSCLHSKVGYVSKVSSENKIFGWAF